MKATIKIDASPQEMRALLGLPDVEALQQEMLEKIRAKTLEGIEANDPAELMRMLMPGPEQLKSLEAMQKAFWQSFGGNLDTTGDKDKD